MRSDADSCTTTRTGAHSGMDPNELHAKAIIAAALISSRAIGVPSLPSAATRASGKDEGSST